MSRQYSGLLIGAHLCFLIILACSSLVNEGRYYAHAQYVATTTVSLTICGDALVAPNEFCDDGVNSGAYANSIASRNCDPLCSAWGPYCGDGVVQVFYGEECDDSNNDAADYCDVTCQNETEPVVVGGGGGGGSGGGGGKGSGNRGIPGASTDGEIDYEGETDVSVAGRAYPGATITVLQDGEVNRVIEADSSANFDFRLTDQTPGITTLGFWAEDTAGRKSVTYAATFQVVQNAVTTLSGVLIPPTVAVVPEKAPPGSTVSFEGSALPESIVRAFVNNSEEGEETFAASNGEWGIAYDTTSLSAEAFHTVKARYIDSTDTELKSGHSLITSFYVGNQDVTGGGERTADLNSDSAVNLTDFSVLLFNWNTANAVADIDSDGIVSLSDFSIMLFYWTG